MDLLNKKGDLRRIGMILLVGMLSFMAFVSYFALAETTAEEKARLDAELAEIEQKLAIISAGFGQDFGGLLCGVEKINENCNEINDEIVRIMLRIMEIKEELKRLSSY